MGRDERGETKSPLNEILDTPEVCTVRRSTLFKHYRTMHVGLVTL